MSNSLLEAELFVRLCLMEKQAAQARGLSLAARGLQDILRGGHQAITGTTSAIGGAAERALGGGILGKGAHGVVKASPYVAGAYGAEKVLGDPASRYMQGKLRQYRARLAAQRATFDPETGVMY